MKSFRANGDTLICYLSTLSQKFIIICLTETWMMDLGPVNDVLQDYNKICSIRLNRRGDGVAIYVKKSYTCLILQSVTVKRSYIESIFLKVVHLNKETVVGSTCRTPNTDFHSFISFF